MSKTTRQIADEVGTVPNLTKSGKPRKKTKLVRGVGINDSPFKTKWTDDDGQEWSCPAYYAWKDMLKRCYSEKFQEDRPTYRGCTVTEEWHYFSAFREWFIAHWVLGWDLDKDLINPGNKIYGPAACVFVPPPINSLLIDSAAIRGKYPQGVCLNGRRLQAQIKINGKRKHLGYFDTVAEAEACYLRAKAKNILRMAAETPDLDPRVAVSLAGRAADMLEQANRIELESKGCTLPSL